MYEFYVKLANINIKITCNYETSRDYYKDYVIQDDKTSEFEVSVDRNDLNYVLNLINNSNYSHKDKQDKYLEILSINSKIAKKLCEYDKFVTHGAAISYKNKGYIFIAPSGTGKTTHIELWKKNLKDVEIINGDKPIISIDDDGIYIYGSPWSGKENYNKNKKVKLDSIIVIKRATQDRIVDIDKNELFNEILDKIYYSDDKNKTLELIDKAFKNIKYYKLECTMNNSAFEVAYKKLVGEQNEI